MLKKKDIEILEGKIDELNQRIQSMSERQNSQYTDIMMVLKNENIIDTRSTEELYEEVKENIISLGMVSVSLIQRMEKIGYAKAAAIVDMLEQRGVIGPSNGSSPREVLIKPEE